MNHSIHKNKKKTKLTTNSEALLCAAFQDKLLREWKIIKKKNKGYIHLNPRKNLTFAQKIGIEDRPPSPLTKKQWKIIHKKCIDRNDIKYGCSICCDHFKTKKQVLLSCSHTFHAQCLHSFEHYSQMRCCPLCRSKDYEKKVINDGIKCKFSYIQWKKSFVQCMYAVIYFYI